MANEYPPLPPPSIHAAAHYGTWLVRESHRHDEPKAGAFRNAARMLAVLEAEVRRLHAELIAAQAQEAAPRDTLHDCAAGDSDYAAGMLLGWNLCTDGRDEEFRRIREDRLRAAASASKEAQEAALAAQGSLNENAVLEYLDTLQDDAAAHIWPDDLERCRTSECTVEVASVRMSSPDGKTVPLFSRDQVVDALIAAQQKGGEV